MRAPIVRGDAEKPRTSGKAASPVAIQRKEAEPASAPADPTTAAPAGPATGTPLDPTQSGPLGVIVTDDTTPQPGQMRRADFVASLRSRVEAACNEELADTGQTATGCPYIVGWLGYYEGQAPAHLERAIQAYTGVGGGDATAVLAAVTDRAREATRRWKAGGDAGTPAAPAGPPGTTDGTPVQTKPAEGAAPSRDAPVAVRARLGAGVPLDGGVRVRMEQAFGESFASVRVHSDNRAAAVARGLSARAFTVGDDVAFASNQYRPGTIPGDLLIAHELAHTVQQRGGTRLSQASGLAESQALETEADRAAISAVSPGIAEASLFTRSPLRLQRCKDCGSSSTTATGTSFSAIRDQMNNAPDDATRQQILESGVAAARANAQRLAALSASSDPIKGIRDGITGETNITATGKALDSNPLFGVTPDMVEEAYRAWSEGGRRGKEPWILLATWIKEGATKPLPPGTVTAASAADARARWRSDYYYYNQGTDTFRATIATSTDNDPDPDPAHNEARFTSQIAAQVAAGRLPRDISGEINSALVVTPVGDAGSGQYQVTPTPRFFTLSLMLTDAYYRENEAALAGDPRFASGGVVDPALVYARWNMGSSRFAGLVSSAEGHRNEPAYRPDGGVAPSISQWAFHTPIKKGEYDQPRRNAVRFAYYAAVYRLAYEGF